MHFTNLQSEWTYLPGYLLILPQWIAIHKRNIAFYKYNFIKCLCLKEFIKFDQNKKKKTIIPTYENDSNSHSELLFRIRKYSKQLYVLYI